MDDQNFPAILSNLKDFYKKINTPEFINKFLVPIPSIEQGIPEEDLNKISEFVQKNNLIVLIRPVEILTKTLHEEKKYPTKGFKIKAKSASWGAWAGFIPINQYFSKLMGANTEKIEKANKDVQDCINKGYAKTVDLKITEKRFKELQKRQIIFPQKKQEDGYLVIYCPHPLNNNKFELCYAKKENTKSGTEYAIYTATKKPFQVLADTKLERALIADYDLLALYHSWEHFGREKIRPNPDVTFEKRSQNLSANEQRRSIESAKNFYDREIPNLGNIPPETIKTISELNKALGKGKHLKCFHHNDDAGSPASDPKANYPITALLPKLEGLPKILLIKSAKEFVDFIKKIKKFDYRVEVNPLWEQAVQLAAKEDFYQKIVLFERYSSKNIADLKYFLKEIFKSIGTSDSILIDEIINVLLPTIKKHMKIDFEKFFDIIESCLLINSVLVSEWCQILDNLLNKNLLTDEVFFNIQELVIELKEDIPGFSELSATIIHFESLEALQPREPEERLNYLLNLAKKCIEANKLDKFKFKTGLNERMLSLKPDEELTTSMRLNP